MNLLWFACLFDLSYKFVNNKTMVEKDGILFYSFVVHQIQLALIAINNSKKDLGF